MAALSGVTCESRPSPHMWPFAPPSVLSTLLYICMSVKQKEERHLLAAHRSIRVRGSPDMAATSPTKADPNEIGLSERALERCRLIICVVAASSGYVPSFLTHTRTHMDGGTPMKARTRACEQRACGCVGLPLLHRTPSHARDHRCSQRIQCP